MPDDIQPPTQPAQQAVTEVAQQPKPLDEFFIKLQTPVAIRRTLLETSKEVLGMLKKNYQMQELRSKKKEAIAVLKRELKELSMLVGKLEEMVPQYSKEDIKKNFPQLDLERRERKAAKPAAPEPKPQEAAVKEAVKSADDDMERLSKQLASVEEKMMSLPRQESANAPAPEPATSVDDLSKALENLKNKLKEI